MDRFNFLYNKYREQFLPDKFKKLILCDPTSKQKGNKIHAGKYCQWILKNYDYPLLEIEETLSKFEKVKHLLEIKDINKYNFTTLYETIIAVWDEKFLYTKAEHKKIIKNRGVKVVFENNEYDVVIPLTPEAAYEISGPPFTTWCTSHKESGKRFFDRYVDDGPLYIIRSKKHYLKLGRKEGYKPIFQLHLASGLFCNAKDSTIPLKKIFKGKIELREFFRMEYIKYLNNNNHNENTLYQTLHQIMDVYKDDFFYSKLLKVYIERFNLDKWCSIDDTFDRTGRLLFKKYGYEFIIKSVLENLHKDVEELIIRLYKYEGDGMDIDLGRFTKIKHLVLEGFLKNFPKNIGKLKKLSLFSCSKNKVKTIPKEVLRHPTLEVFSTDLKSLPKFRKKIYVKRK